MVKGYDNLGPEYTKWQEKKQVATLEVPDHSDFPLPCITSITEVISKDWCRVR